MMIVEAIESFARSLSDVCRFVDEEKMWGVEN